MSCRARVNKLKRRLCTYLAFVEGRHYQPSTPNNIHPGYYHARLCQSRQRWNSSNQTALYHSECREEVDGRRTLSQLGHPRSPIQHYCFAIPFLTAFGMTILSLSAQVCALRTLSKPCPLRPSLDTPQVPLLYLPRLTEPFIGAYESSGCSYNRVTMHSV